MRRLKKWAAVLLAVAITAGNMPVAYAQENEYSELQEAPADSDVPTDTEEPDDSNEPDDTDVQEEAELLDDADAAEEDITIPDSTETDPEPVKNEYVWHDSFSLHKIWNDTDAESVRPVEKNGLFQLYYKVLDYTTEEIPTTGYKAFTEENTKADFGEDWWKTGEDDLTSFPEPSVTEDDNGTGWTYSYQNALPKQVTIPGEDGNQKTLYVYYAVKEVGSDASYTLSSLTQNETSWTLENTQLNAYEAGSDESQGATLKTPEQADGDAISIANTRCQEPFTVTINWKDNSNAYLTRPGRHKAGDRYNYQKEDGNWAVRTLSSEEADSLNEQELAHFKEGLVLKAMTSSGNALPVENAQMEIEDLDTDTWTLKIKGLPALDSKGNPVTYYLEHNHKDGLSVNNVPVIKDEVSPEVGANPGGEYRTSVVNQGVDTGVDTDKLYTGAVLNNVLEKNMWATFYSKWEDEGADKANRPKSTVYLYRVAESGTDQTVDFGQLHPVAGYDNASVPTDEDEAIIRFGYEDGTEGKLPLYNANGQRYIYYAIVNIPGAGDYVQLINNTTGNYSDQAMQEADKEGYLLCMGTLTLRRQAKVSLTASKTFVAASMQDIHNMENVSVTLMLQKSENGRTDWENVTDDKGALVTRKLEGFRGEQLSITSEEPYEAPKYNEKGAEIKYRWVETSMTMDDQSSTVEKDGEYFADQSIQTPAGADGTISPVGPGAGGVNSTAHFRVIYNEDGSVTNRLMGNTEMIVTKTWAINGWGTDKNMTLQQWLNSEKGALYKNQTISFRLNRNDGKSSISAGAEGTENTLYGYSYNENGTLVRNDPIRDITIHVGENLSAEDARNIWKNLPRYDEDGSEYIYSVEEMNNDDTEAKLWNSSKTYTREVVFDQEHNDYYVRKKAAFVNSSNGGQMYFQAGKVWLDQGDLLCRKPVQAALYHKENDQWLKVPEIGENGSDTVTLDDKNNWFTEFSITPVNGDTDYSHYLIVEEKIGENGTVDYSGRSFDEIATQSKSIPMHYNSEKDYKDFFDGNENESAEQVQEKLQAAVAGQINGNDTGLRHNYNVYLSANDHGRYFIYNQRTGTVNVDVKKTWKTGSNSTEKESSVLAITQNGNPIVWLKLDKQKQTAIFGLIDMGYSNSWSSSNPDSVLTLGSTGTGIPQDNLKLYNTSTLYQRGNYPKYDGMGRLYRYGIEEEAILLRKADTEDYYTVTKVDQSKKKGRKVLATVETTDESNKKIYHEYTISQSSSVKYADPSRPGASDQYSFSVTNAREQMLTLTADKVWQDDGSQAADAKEKRPDISFYLYRTTKYKSADALLQAFNDAIGSQQDPTNIPRETIESAQQRLINQSEIVKINGNGKFQWNTKQNDWYWISSRFTENERYDENGDPYIYFLIEKIPHSGSGVYNGEYHTRYNNAHIGSQIGSETISASNANTKLFSAQADSDAASTEEVYEPNYLDDRYRDTLSPGLLIVSDGIHSVPVKTTYVNGVQSNEIVAEGTEGAVRNYNSYWAHTVINYRVDQDKISGQKIWQLPGGQKMDESYLPDVTFRLRRQSGKGTEASAVDPSDFRKNLPADTVENNALYVTLGQHKKTNAAAEKVGFTGTNSYAYTISDLPVYDKYGQKYLYSVQEDNFDKITYFKMGDHPADSAVSFVNYYTGDPKAKLSFTKEWSVGAAPTGSLFSLDPVKGTITVTTNGKTTVTSLPKSLTFQIRGYFTEADGKGAEIASASYTAVVNADYQESNYTLKGTIKCNGGDQTSGDTAPKMTVTMDSASTGNTKAVWKVELSNLKSLAPDGKSILYEVTETVPDGYEGTSTGETTLENSTTGSQTPVYSGQTFQNAYTGKKTGGSYTSITVQKKWDDMGYDRKPEEITLTLYRKNAKEADNPDRDVVIEDSLTLSSANSWKAEVGKAADGSPTLPVYAPDGQPYAYYLTEIQENSSYQLTGSQTQYGTDGAIVTATNVLPRGRISFKKSWKTQIDEQDPKPLTSRSDFDRLLNLGALPKVTFTVQYLDNSHIWQDLKLKGNTVSTTFDPRTNPDHYRNNLFTGQNYYTVPLYREGTNSPGNNNENYQQYRIKETIQHADGTTEDLYSENIIAGNTQTDDTTASITNTVQVVQVEILKKWEDNHDRDGRRPEQLSTYLKAQNSDGKWQKMEEMAVLPDDATITTLTEEERHAGDTYTTGVMLLPKAHASLAITEAEVGGYSPAEQIPVSGSRTLSDGTSVATYTFTNTCVPKLFHISAEKMWNDEENKYGLRNENGSVDLTLWYRLGDTGNWNKVTTAPETIRKYYRVNGVQKLYYDDSMSVYTTTILKEDGSLTCTSGTPAVWENLPANAMVHGSTVKVQYKITESGANKAYTGMTSSTDDSAFNGTIQFKGTDGEKQHFKITNTLQTTSLTIHKEWKLEEQVADGESYRPDEITFQVEYRAKTEQTWKDLPGGRVTMTKPAGIGSWTKILTGLPVCDQNGNAYEYRVSEISLTYKKLLGSNTDQVTGSFHTEEDGTETWTGDAGRYLVTVTTEKNADGSFTASAENALIDRYHQFSVEVSKQWKDGDNRFGLRPDHNGAVLKLQYSLDGGTTWADITKAELNWDNCYEDNHGVYTTSEPQQTAIAVSADTKGSPARWENLPGKVLVNGRSHLVQYQVREADYPAYEATIGPEQITWEEAEGEVRTVQVKNIMKTTSLFIQKNWSDENGVKNARALRPEQVEVKLEYAAGNATDWKALPSGTYQTTEGKEVRVDSEGLLLLSEKDGWKQTLTGLPVCNADGQIFHYRVTETRLLYKDGQIYTVKNGDAGRYQVSETTVQDADGTWKAVLTNQLVDRYQARITKHAETLDGPVLEGAGYVLYRPEQMDYYTGQDASGNATWGIWNDAKILYTGSDGTTMISGLPRGSYQFVEVAAAKGYRIDSTPIDFTIGDDNIGTICEVHQADLKRTGGHRHRDTSEKTISGTAATEIKPVGPPRTGDDNDWRIYAGMSVGLLAVIAVLLRKLKNH